MDRVLLSSFSQRFSGVFIFLVIKKIIIPELMGALLKFFEIDLCISQLAAIVNAVGHPSPPPLSPPPSLALLHSCCHPAFCSFDVFERLFRFVLHTKQLVACNRRRIWFASVGLCQRARQKTNLWFIENICCSLSFDEPSSLSLSLSHYRKFELTTVPRLLLLFWLLHFVF